MLPSYHQWRATATFERRDAANQQHYLKGTKTKMSHPKQQGTQGTSSRSGYNTGFGSLLVRPLRPEATRLNLGPFVNLVSRLLSRGPST
jgi:hypothetical protein